MGIIYFMDGIVDLYYSPKINYYFKIQNVLNESRLPSGGSDIWYLIFMRD